jgi:hypothetical protein
MRSAKITRYKLTSHFGCYAIWNAKSTGRLGHSINLETGGTRKGCSIEASPAPESRPFLLQRLKRFLDNRTDQSPAIGDFHSVARSGGGHKKVACNDRSVFSRDFARHDSYDRERNLVVWKRLVDAMSACYNAGPRGVDPCHERRVRRLRERQATLAGCIDHKQVARVRNPTGRAVGSVDWMVLHRPAELAALIGKVKWTAQPHGSRFANLTGRG